MKFWKLGLVVGMLCVSFSVQGTGYQDPSLTPEDILKDVYGQPIGNASKINSETAQKIQFSEGLTKFKNSLEPLEKAFGGKIDIDDDSFLNFEGMNSTPSQKTAAEKFLQGGALSDFIGGIRENYTYTYKIPEKYQTDGETELTLYPGSRLHFTIRLSDDDNPDFVEENGVGSFFINVHPTTTVTAENLTQHLKEQGNLTPIWEEYITTFPIFQKVKLDPAYKKLRATTADGKPTTTDVDHGETYTKLLRAFSTQLFFGHDFNAPGKKIQDFNDLTKWYNATCLKFSSFQNFKTPDGLQYLSSEEKPLVTVEGFLEKMKDVKFTEDADFATEREKLYKEEKDGDGKITKTGIYVKLENIRQQLLLHLPFPPVSNGGILAGPPFGQSGYDYVVNKFIPKYANGAISFLFGFSVLFLIVGGIMYLVSSGDQDLVKKAKDVIMWSLVACIIAAFSWMIVKFVISINFG